MEPTQEDDLQQRMAEEVRENDEEQKQREPKAELDAILESFANYAVEVVDEKQYERIAYLIEQIREELCK